MKGSILFGEEKLQECYTERTWFTIRRSYRSYDRIFFKILSIWDLPVVQ